MTPEIAAQLIATFGLPLVQQITAWIEAKKTTVTSADLQLLATLGQYRSADALAEAGIKIVDGKVLQLNGTAGA